ncbi:hypothetical protein [Alteribacillus sp. HJP-4]|uniref:hypothetical protein n=1 Tax=Alteribacillus sp. HJP-4 TaxID=2775394 RepID=UPI0035CD31C7
MNNISRVTAFAELHGLILFYKENRDLPVSDDFNFFDEVKKCCDQLDLDYEEFIKEFNLTTGLS